MFLLALLSAVIDPCKLMTVDDVERLTGWVASAPPSKKRYHLPQESGTTCSLSAQEGIVVITVPDGDSFGGSGVYANPVSNGSATQIHIHDGYAEIFNNSAYVAKHHRHAVVKILPMSEQATQEVLAAAAEIVARRLP